MSRIATAFTMTAALLSLTSPAMAQQEAADGTSPRVTVLKAARLFDGKSDTLSLPGLVVVAGRKIAAVGPGAEVLEGATVIDLGDATLCPGFIDAHTHLTGQL